MWEPDAKLYVFLLFVWAFLLVASLATVSPEPMYLMTEGELSSLSRISDALRETSEALQKEADSWKQTSERLDAELETSLMETDALRSELSEQRRRSEALGAMLKESETRASVSATQAEQSATLASSFEQSLVQSAADLFRARLERNIWRGAALVAAVLALIGFSTP